MTSREISAVLFYNTLNMSSKKIFLLVFTSLTHIFVLSIERGLSTLE
jgi:hypothetical protein